VYPTTEVRWFQEGDTPTTLRDWFNACPGPVTNQLPRIDYYLPFAFTHDIGIKIREGQLEIKILHEELGVSRWHTRVTGRLQSWQKWGLNVEGDGDPLGQPGDLFSEWLPVQKSRRLRRYLLGENGRVVPISEEAFIPASCGLELTSIRSQGQVWWSLALEIHGIGADSLFSLEAIASQLFDSSQPPLLVEADSMSYPGWINLHMG